MNKLISLFVFDISQGLQMKDQLTRYIGRLLLKYDMSDVITKGSEDKLTGNISNNDLLGQLY